MPDPAAEIAKLRVAVDVLAAHVRDSITAECNDCRDGEEPWSNSNGELRHGPGGEDSWECTAAISHAALSDAGLEPKP